MIKHPDQRVGVFIDVGNMYHSAKNLYKSRVNFAEVLKEAVGKRKLIRASAYAVESNSEEEVKFFEALDKQGFEVNLKQLQIFAGGMKKGDWDIGITIDMIKMAPKLDVVILVTGDGDYIPAVGYLQNHFGTRVEVIGFAETTSGTLQEIADDYLDLSSDKRRFLIKK